MTNACVCNLSVPFRISASVSSCCFIISRCLSISPPSDVLLILSCARRGFICTLLLFKLFWSGEPNDGELRKGTSALSFVFIRLHCFLNPSNTTCRLANSLLAISYCIDSLLIIARSASSRLSASASILTCATLTAAPLDRLDMIAVFMLVYLFAHCDAVRASLGGRKGALRYLLSISTLFQAQTPLCAYLLDCAAGVLGGLAPRLRLPTTGSELTDRQINY